MNSAKNSVSAFVCVACVVWFPPIPLKTIPLNRWFYVLFGDGKSGGTKSLSNVLVRTVKRCPEGVWFQHVEGSPTVPGYDPKKPVFSTFVRRDDTTIRVFSIPSLDPEEVFVSLKSDQFFIDLLYKDVSITRIPGGKDLRVKTLVKAIKKALSQVGDDQSLWMEDEEVLERKVSVFVKEALLIAKTENPHGNLNLGTIRTNTQIVARTILKSFDRKGEEGGLLRNKMLIESMSVKLDKLSQQFSALMSSLPGQGPPGPPPFPPHPSPLCGSVLDMVPNGRCCYQLAGVALMLSGNPRLALSSLTSIHKECATLAKEHLLNNLVAVSDALENITITLDGEHFASAQWRRVIGLTSEEICRSVLDGVMWGGAVELALSLWHTNIEVVVILVDELRGVTDVDSIRGVIQPAALGDLPSGPSPKTLRVFALLRGGHYSLGTITQEGSRTALFPIADGVADLACSTLVGMLITTGKGNPHHTGPSVRNRTPAVPPGPNPLQQRRAPPLGPSSGSQRKPGPTVVLARKAIADTAPCRSFVKHGVCHYGTRCKFIHFDPRKPTSRISLPPPLPRRASKPVMTPSNRKTHRQEPDPLSRKSSRSSGLSSPEVPRPRTRHYHAPVVVVREYSRRVDPNLTSRSLQPPKTSSVPVARRRDVGWRDTVATSSTDIHRSRHPKPSLWRQIRVKCPEPVLPARWRDSLKIETRLRTLW